MLKLYILASLSGVIICLLCCMITWFISFATKKINNIFLECFIGSMIFFPSLCGITIIAVMMVNYLREV